MLPSIFGFLGKDAIQTKNEVYLIMKSFCIGKYLFYKDKRCDKFSALGCYNKFTQECDVIGYQTIRENLASSICSKNLISRLGLGNRLGYIAKSDKRIRDTENLISLGVYIFMILSFTYLIFYIFKKISDYDNQVLTTKDFSVRIGGLPKKGDITKEEGYNLRQLLKSKIQMSGYHVEKINFLYSLGDYQDMRAQFCKKISDRNMRNYRVQYRIKNGQEMTETSKPKDPVYNMLDSIVERVLECQEESFERCDPEFLLGSAFISFTTWNEAHKFQDYYKKSGFLFTLFGVCGSRRNHLSIEIGGKEFELTVYTAVEPSDVIWKNQGFSKFSRWVRHFIVSIAIVVFVVSGLSVFAYLKIVDVSSYTISNPFQANYASEQKLKISNNNRSFLTPTISFMMNYILPIIIKGIDMFLQFMTWTLVSFQKKPTVSREELSATRFLWRVKTIFF